MLIPLRAQNRRVLRQFGPAEPTKGKGGVCRQQRVSERVVSASSTVHDDDGEHRRGEAKRGFELSPAAEEQKDRVRTE